ncbi:MAG: HDOD domain-containing protein [Pseudomonadota bacterium]
MANPAQAADSALSASHTPQSLVDGITNLVSFPEVAIAIDNALVDGTSGTAEIGALIEPDPGLSAALLKLANSAMYNKGGAIDSVERAVLMVGGREVRDLTFAIAAAQTFSGISSRLITVEDFWFHSLSCAVIARELASRHRVFPAASPFTAGLLADLGQLVMYVQAPEQSEQVLRHSRAHNDGLTLYLSEREIFGFDHMEVGEALARSWDFPEPLSICIGKHHEPHLAGDLADNAALVAAANGLAVLLELESNRLEDMPPLAEDIVEHFDLANTATVDAIIDSARGTVDDLLRMFIS